MEKNLKIKNGIKIPFHELEISASRAGGPGGQHVNKASTKITIRWNIKNTSALNEDNKKRLIKKLESRLTKNGDLVIHNSKSRSQQKNKENVIAQLVKTINKALYVPKKRIATQVPEKEKEFRLKEKIHRGRIKKLRRVKKFDD